MSDLTEVTGSADYQQLLDATPIGMALIGPNLEHRQANAIWADMIGYTPEELVTRSMSQMTYGLDRQSDQALTRLLAEGRREPFTTTKIWVRRDGTLVRVVMTVSPLSEPALKGCGLATFVPDANQVFDQLQTRKVAHDLLSVLHAIGLSAESIRNTSTDHFFPDSILQATTLAASMVTNLLRADHSVRGSCCANRVIESCVAIVRSTMPANIRIHYSYSGRTAVAIDETKLSEVVLNLLTHARDAIKGAGSISVHCQPHGDFVVLSVRDTGDGLSDDQVHSITRGLYEKPDGTGPGMGLPLANSIIQGAAGSLRITSTEGMGTEVICQLPSPNAKAPVDRSPQQQTLNPQVG